MPPLGFGMGVGPVPSLIIFNNGPQTFLIVLTYRFHCVEPEMPQLAAAFFVIFSDIYPISNFSGISQVGTTSQTALSNRFTIDAQAPVQWKGPDYVRQSQNIVFYSLNSSFFPPCFIRHFIWHDTSI